VRLEGKKSLPVWTVAHGLDGVSVECWVQDSLLGVGLLEVYEMVHEELEGRGIAPLHSL
jgi:hypothetical protein